MIWLLVAIRQSCFRLQNVRFMMAAAPSDGGPPLALEEYSDSLHKSTLGLIQNFSGETNGHQKGVAKLVAVGVRQFEFCGLTFQKVPEKISFNVNEVLSNKRKRPGPPFLYPENPPALIWRASGLLPFQLALST